MQGVKRKIVYVSLYEIIAIAVVALSLSFFSHSDMDKSALAAIGATVIAVIWNFIFNTLFERWESKQSLKGRSIKRRAAHAIGFEGGIALLTIPWFMWLLHISLWQAIVMDIGFLLFFLVYTYVFNYCFDKIFGLPSSAL